LAAAGAVVGAASADSMTSQHQDTPLLVLIYIGPVVMSFGCFALIFAFVVFCEARDHAIEYYVRSNLYLASVRGPRHCQLPFRHSVIDHILQVSKRHAEKVARLAPLTVLVTSPSPQEDVEFSEQLDNSVDGGRFNADRGPSLVPVSVDVSMPVSTDWLLGNGILQTASLSPSSNHGSACVIQQSSRSPSPSNEQPQTTALHAPTSLDQSNVETYHLDYEHPTIKRSSRPDRTVNGESSRDAILSSFHDQLETESILQDDPSAALSLSSGLQPSSERDNKMSPGKCDHAVDSVKDERTAQDAGWTADGQAAEATPLMLDRDSLSDTGGENVEPETKSMTYVPMSLSLSSTSLATSSLSSSSVLLDVRMLLEEDLGDRVELSTLSASASAPSHSEDVTDKADSADVSSGSSTAESSQLSDRSIPTAGGSIEARSCRVAAADGGESSPTSGRAEGRGKPVDTERDRHETARRPHAWIHCPPPLPPPPTSPASVRSPRRH